MLLNTHFAMYSQPKMLLQKAVKDIYQMVLFNLATTMQETTGSSHPL